MAPSTPSVRGLRVWTNPALLHPLLDSAGDQPAVSLHLPRILPNELRSCNTPEVEDKEAERDLLGDGELGIAGAGPGEDTYIFGDMHTADTHPAELWSCHSVAGGGELVMCDSSNNSVPCCWSHVCVYCMQARHT